VASDHRDAAYPLAVSELSREGLDHLSKEMRGFQERLMHEANAARLLDLVRNLTLRYRVPGQADDGQDRGTLRSSTSL
jgi:hypothetical protein